MVRFTTWAHGVVPTGGVYAGLFHRQVLLRATRQKCRSNFATVAPGTKAEGGDGRIYDVVGTAARNMVPRSATNTLIEVYQW
jgi:hypothetical protein